MGRQFGGLRMTVLATDIVSSLMETAHLQVGLWLLLPTCGPEVPLIKLYSRGAHIKDKLTRREMELKDEIDHAGLSPYAKTVAKS
jgi:hypothetical protein